MKIYIGADHRGFELKEKLKEFLMAYDMNVIDCGADSIQPDDDYPQFALAVGRAVTADEAPTTGSSATLGITICGSGIGVCVAANKIAGVRAATVWTAEIAAHVRQRDDINVLCLSADYTTAEDAINIARTFIATPFVGAERDKRRIAQIIAAEKE